MTVGKLIDQLKVIMEVHPEAEDSQAWAQSNEAGFKFQIKTIGWDSKHRPQRIKFED